MVVPSLRTSIVSASFISAFNFQDNTTNRSHHQTACDIQKASSNRLNTKDMTPNEIATQIWGILVLFLGPLLSESLKKSPVLVQPGWESTKFPERPHQVGGGQADPENTDANNAGARAAAAAINQSGQGEDAPVASAPPTPPNRPSLRFDLVPLPMDFP